MLVAKRVAVRKVMAAQLISPVESNLKAYLRGPAELQHDQASESCDREGAGGILGLEQGAGRQIYVVLTLF